MNCPETNKKSVDPPHSGGGGFPGELGVGKISKVREISWTAEKIDKLLFTPHPTQQVGGGGLGVKIGGTDGREGLMGGRREGCDGNYEVDPVHRWHGMGA